MATLDSTHLTFGDYARRTDMTGTIPVISELLDQRHDFVSALPFTQCNELHSHRTLFRTSLPTVSRLKANAGYPLSTSEATPVANTTTRIGVAMEIDKMVAEAYAHPGELIASEGHAFWEAMQQKAIYDMNYGSKTDDKDGIDGLAARYNSLSGNIGQQVVTGAGAQSDNTSVWFAVLGPQTLYGIYPKVTDGAMGLRDEDKGEQMVTLSSGNRQLVYQRFFTWDYGLVVQNTAAVSRIPNIDVGELTGGTAADLFKLMTKAYHRVMKFKNMGRPVALMNSTVFQQLDIQSREDQAYTLTRETIAGQEVTSFRGFEILVTDALKNDEAVVS